MDTSETYIKMRQMAIPDLGKGKPLNHPCNETQRWFWSGTNYQWVVVVDTKGDWYAATHDAFTFQLERQDQLQAMVVNGKDNVPYWTLSSEFYEYLLVAGDGHHPMSRYKSASMEQLWLAFVMNDKYNKSWDGESWVSMTK